MSPAAAERIYRLLLRAYPPEFRAGYEREMVLLFRDQCQESDVRTLRFWGAVIYDVARSAPALRAEAWRSRGSESTQTTEVIMKLAAMLTLLLGGVIGILNAAVEWVAASEQSISGTHEVSLVFGVLASALLLAAGVAILNRTQRGRQAARLALFASLVMIVAARLLFPWMSYLSQLVGFGLTVALLIALYRPRKSSPLGAA
jgi:hypothetical protein